MTALPGCYYAHLADGQARLLWARRPVADVLEDPDAEPALRDALALVEDARLFAAELGLEVGDQYTSFAEWPGDRVVTSVVATRPGEIEAAGFRFPIVGRVPYKGFFDPARAEAEAERLRAKGLDVCVVPVAAYSTLGWFSDPLTGPMLRGGDGELVETVIHELVHATVFVESAADFNEGVATFVGQEGAVRFFAARDGEVAAAAERQRISEDRLVAAELARLRTAVGELYEEPAGAARDARRGELEADARARLAALPLQHHDAERLAEGVRLNDACLALAGTYQADLEAMAVRLEAADGDLSRFVAAVRAAAEAPDPRAALLE